MVGNSVNCPSVTYNKNILGTSNIFTSTLKFSLDWDTFLKLSRMKGRVGYIDERLICYRIHSNATTVKFINNDKRTEEDIIMFRKMWPKVFIPIIMKFYSKASDTYGGCDE